MTRSENPDVRYAAHCTVGVDKLSKFSKRDLKKRIRLEKLKVPCHIECFRLDYLMRRSRNFLSEEGVQLLQLFLVDEEREDKRAIIGPNAKLAGGPMMAQHCILAW